MTLDEFRQSLTATEPPAGLTRALAGLWWDARAIGRERTNPPSRTKAPRIVGSRLPASQGRRSGQRGVLVRPGRQARLPGATRCGMAQHCERIAEVEPTVALVPKDDVASSPAGR